VAVTAEPVVFCCSPVTRRPLSAEEARVFKAVGDPVRLRLLSLLREAGLIEGERRATWIYYRIRPQLLRQLSDVLVPDPAGRPA
jgi:ArsR family transcriptional regulator